MKLSRKNWFLFSSFNRFFATSAIVVSFLGGARAASVYWDGGTTAIAGNGNGASAGGAGNWDVTLTNWDAGAVAHVAWVNANNDTAVFGGTAGTVTLTAPVSAGALTFSTAGYTVAGTSPNILTFGGTTGTITASGMATSATTTINAPIAGTLPGGLAIASSGDTSVSANAAGLGVKLGGTNTFTGDITITSGLVSYASDAAFGASTNTIILNGGGLLENVTLTMAHNIQIGAAGGYLREYGAATATYTGVLSGSGPINRSDGGTVIFAGNNTYTGTFNCGTTGYTAFTGTNAVATYNVTAGNIQVGNNGSTGALAAGSTLNLGASASLYIKRNDAVTASAILPGTITLAGANSRLEYASNLATGTLNFDMNFGSNVANGYFRVSGGAMSLASGTTVIADTVSLGSQSATNQGILNILPGSAVTTHFFNIGETSSQSGVINQSGGTVTIASGGNGFRLGHWNNNSSPGNAYNLTGGTLDGTAMSANPSGTAQYINIGWDGQASMTVGGGAGAATMKAFGIQLDASGDSTAYNDTLTVSANGSVEIGTLGVSSASVNDLVILNGGVLKASGAGTWSTVINTIGTSTINANGFGVTLPGNLTGSGTVNLPSTTGSVTFSTTGVQTVSAVLAGTTPLTKAGAGSLTLSAANTHTGTMVVTAGTLNLTGSSASSTTLQTGATLAGEGSLSGSLVLSGGSTLQVDLSTPGALATNTVDISGKPTVRFTSTPTQAQGAMKLFTHAGTLTGNPSTDLIFPALRSPVVTDTAGVVSLSVTNMDLLWNGAGGNVWDAGFSTYWNPGDTDAFYTGDSVTFDDNGSSATISLSGELIPSAVTVNSSFLTYSFTGTGYISGSATLTKSGPSTLTVSTPNTYTGLTTVNAGILKLGNATALGSDASGTVIASGATLDANGQNLSSLNEAITVSGTGSIGQGALTNTSATKAYLRNITLTGDTTVSQNTGTGKLMLGSSIGQNGTLNLAGFTLTKAGAGTTTINGVNMTGAGNINVTAGTLQIFDDYNTNQQDTALSGTGNLTIASGAAVRINRWASGFTMSMPVVLNGGILGSDWPGPNGATISSPISLGASSTLNFNGGYGVATLTGIVSGAGTSTLTISSDNLTLSGANTYSGATLVTAGTLKLGNPNALGATTAGTTVSSGATLDVNGQDLTLVPEAITIGGTGVGGNGAIVNTSTTAGTLSNVTLSSNTTINLANTLTIGASSATATGTLALGSNTLTKTGTGTLILNSVAVTSGNIAINQGTVQLVNTYLSGNSNFQQATSITSTGTITIAAGATLSTNRFGVGFNVTTPIVLNGGTIQGFGPGPNGATYASPISLTANSTFDFNAGGYSGGLSSAVFSGVISGNFMLTRIGGSADVTTLTGANTYSGGTMLTGGIVAFNSGSLGSTGTITMNGGSLRWNGTNTQDISARLAMVAAVTATFDTNGNSVTFATGIGGGTSAALTKAGAGSLTLSGTNTYTGATTVSAGTLNLTGSATSAITVAGAAGIGGEGSTTGAITLAEGSTLTADAATPTNYLTTTGALTVAKTTSGVAVVLQNPTATAGAKVVPIVKYGTQTGGTTNFNLAGYRSASVTDDTTNKILSLNYTADAKVWNGATGNTAWDLSVSSDWTGTDLLFYNGDAVSFTETATSKAVAVTGTVTPSAISVNNTTAYTFSGTGVIAGSGVLTKAGTGTMSFTQTVANTFSGGTVINAGLVSLGSGGNENVNALGSGTVTINSGGKLGFYPGSSSTVFNFPNNIVLNGGTVHQEDGYQHLAGNVSVTADSILEARWTPKSLTIDGILSGSGKLTFNDSGSGAYLYLTNPLNTYTGALTTGSSTDFVYIQNNTALQFATVDTGATTASIVIAATNSVPNVILAGLKGTAGSKVLNGDATARVLTLNTAADFTYAGSIGDGSANGNNLSVVKSGTNAMILSGSSTYSGTTTINGGELQGFVSITAGAKTPFSGSTITANSGTTLRFKTSSTFNMISFANPISLNSATLACEDGLQTLSGPVILSGSNTINGVWIDKNITMTGVVSGSGLLTKIGSAGLTLTNTNSYSGAVSVTGGFLEVNGSLAATTTSIGSGVALRGTGSIAGGTTVNGSVSPGSGVGGVGTLSLANATVTGTYTCDLNGASADKLAVSGTLTLTGATLAFNTVAAPTAANYLIATYTGTAPTFTTVTGLPAGYTVDYSVAGQISLKQQGYTTWAAANAGGQAANLDYDKDGVPNGVEYFMGQTGSSFTPNPSVINGKVTWPKDPTANATYVVQTSTDLVTWTTATGVVDNPTSVEYTLPTGGPRVFVRIKVTVP